MCIPHTARAARNTGHNWPECRTNSGLQAAAIKYAQMQKFSKTEVGNIVVIYMYSCLNIMRDEIMV